MDRLEEIEAKLAQTDDWGREYWHNQGCDYAMSDSQFPCNCMRLDLEFVIGQLKTEKALRQVYNVNNLIG